ncbi:MAG: hypothetical protein IKL07_09910, partial [Clostridium sp.]|nr:hypothetical protein [Clostridium sp.]
FGVPKVCSLVKETSQEGFIFSLGSSTYFLIIEVVLPLALSIVHVITLNSLDECWRTMIPDVFSMYCILSIVNKHYDSFFNN